MIKKLRIKFIVIIMGIVTIMLCVILGMVLYFTGENMENESLHLMRSLAAAPIQMENAGRPGEEVMGQPYFIIRIDPRGNLVTTNKSSYDLSDEKFLNELIFKAISQKKETGIIKEYPLRYLITNMPRGNCYVFEDISNELKTLKNLKKSCALAGGLSFIALLLISILLSKWAVRPVETAWKQQRQFVADASHELKTPLTVIMTNAELAGSEEYTEEERQRFIDSIMTMSFQMKGLIEQMLELARADYAKQKTVFTEINFSELLEEELLPFEPVFFENEHVLITEIEKEIKVIGEEKGLRQVIQILLDNAGKYAKKQGNVWVKLEKKSGSHCLLTVENEGDPIPQEEWKEIFKRFYRGDKARSRTGSFGLGLSIAESVVSRHKGRIWAESKNGVNSFYVIL